MFFLIFNFIFKHTLNPHRESLISGQLCGIQRQGPLSLLRFAGLVLSEEASNECMRSGWSPEWICAVDMYTAI